MTACIKCNLNPQLPGNVTLFVVHSIKVKSKMDPLPKLLKCMNQRLDELSLSPKISKGDNLDLQTLFKSKSIITEIGWFFFRLVYGLTPLSTIFQLYRSGQFYWWRKPEYSQKTTGLTNFIG